MGRYRGYTKERAVKKGLAWAWKPQTRLSCVVDDCVPVALSQHVFERKPLGLLGAHDAGAHVGARQAYEARALPNA